MAADRAKYHVGQVIHHTLFDYRGVIVDVDPDFRVSPELSGLECCPVKRPVVGPAASPAGPHTQPWYHVLVDGTADHTYVSEDNLEPDPAGGPIEHPDLIDYFADLSAKGYVRHAHAVN